MSKELSVEEPLGQTDEKGRVCTCIVRNGECKKILNKEKDRVELPLGKPYGGAVLDLGKVKPCYDCLTTKDIRSQKKKIPHHTGPMAPLEDLMRRLTY